MKAAAASPTLAAAAALAATAAAAAAVAAAAAAVAAAAAAQWYYGKEFLVKLLLNIMPFKSLTGLIHATCEGLLALLDDNTKFITFV